MFQLLLEHGDFLNTDISQGSVAICLRWGSILKYEFITNLPSTLTVKNVENRLTFGEVMDKSIVSCFFLSHSVYQRVYDNRYYAATQLK